MFGSAGPGGRADGMGIINLDGSHFVDQEIEGGREPPPSLTGEPTAMHEVNPLQCNNSYSGDCGRAGRTGGLTPIPGQALKREGEPRDQSRRAHSGTHSAGSWGTRFPFPSPGKANCPRCPKAQPPPSPQSPPPPVPGAPESRRSRLPIRLRSASQLRPGQPVGRLRRGRAREWSPALPRPGR